MFSSSIQKTPMRFLRSVVAGEKKVNWTKTPPIVNFNSYSRAAMSTSFKH